jgi:hypothetical protein
MSQDIYYLPGEGGTIVSIGTEEVVVPGFGTFSDALNVSFSLGSVSVSGKALGAIAGDIESVLETRVWSMPTNASNGTVANVTLFNDARTVTIDAGVSTAAGGVFRMAASNQSRPLGESAFCLVDDWAGSHAVATINGACGIATITT